MDLIDAKELWRYIPPEEKIDLLNKSHGQGILAAFIAMIVAGTCAVGLQLTWLLWGGILTAPLVFQFAAGRAWRDLKPRLMLEYLAVRSCARRLAFLQNSRSLTAELIFRGTAVEQIEDDPLMEALATIDKADQEEPVWIALFSDVVVVMVERPGGAQLKFGCSIDEKLGIKAEGPNGEDEYSNDRVIHLTYTEKKGTERTFQLSSKHPASLIIFEKKLQYYKNPPKVSLAEAIPDFIEEKQMLAEPA